MIIRTYANPYIMTTPEEKREIADKILKSIENAYGFVPLVNQVLSENPDLFIPSANLGKAAFESSDKALDRKTTYLCAVSAAAALGAEHCLRVQGAHAKEAGATKAEILEAMFTGSYMAMTRSQSYSFRVLQELFKE